MLHILSAYAILASVQTHQDHKVMNLNLRNNNENKFWCCISFSAFVKKQISRNSFFVKYSHAHKRHVGRLFLPPMSRILLFQDDTSTSSRNLTLKTSFRSPMYIVPLVLSFVSPCVMYVSGVFCVFVCSLQEPLARTILMNKVETEIS